MACCWYSEGKEGQSRNIKRSQQRFHDKDNILLLTVKSRITAWWIWLSCHFQIVGCELNFPLHLKQWIYRLIMAFKTMTLSALQWNPQRSNTTKPPTDRERESGELSKSRELPLQPTPTPTPVTLWRRSREMRYQHPRSSPMEEEGSANVLLSTP